MIINQIIKEKKLKKLVLITLYNMKIKINYKSQRIALYKLNKAKVIKALKTKTLFTLSNLK